MSRQCVGMNAKDKMDVIRKIKNAFVGYKVLDGKTRRMLEKLGFEISDQGKHYKIKCSWNESCNVCMAKSSSDGYRAGRNIAAQIIRCYY